MMEAVRTSETSGNFNVATQHNIPEYSKFHTRRRENLKSHKNSGKPETDFSVSCARDKPNTFPSENIFSSILLNICHIEKSFK
jgi:hypothetical protein